MMIESKHLAFYLRLSDEDYDIGKGVRKLKVESNSITNQRNMIKQFIKGKREFAGCNIVEFCDDGYTGTNMNRPGFQDMLKAIEQKKIDTIIFKDYSRFGRNFLMVGKYLEEILPALGIRVISVTDGYDSNKIATASENLIIPFKNLVNEFYVKSLSKSIKSGIKTRQKKGEFISPNAIFGYKKSQENIHKLVLHEETGWIVRRIFDMALGGMNGKEIAKTLNKDGVPTPGWFANQKRQRQYVVDEHTGWTSVKVYKILRDRRYTGDMVGNVRCRKRIAKNETIRIDEDEWIIVPNTHEGIVTKEEFRLVNEELLPVTKRRNVALGADRRKEICVCPYCGRTLKRSNMYKNPYYICLTDVYSDAAECSEIRIREDEILGTVTAILQQYMGALIEDAKVIKSVKQQTLRTNKQVLSLNNLESSVEVLKRRKVAMHESYRSGAITKEEFILQKNKVNQQIEELEEKKYNLLNGIGDMESLERLEKDIAMLIEQYKNVPVMKYSDLSAFVDKIYVYKDKSMRVVFKFADVFERVNDVLGRKKLVG